MSISVFQAAESRRTKHLRRRGEREAHEREVEALVEAVGQGLELPPFITPGSYSGEERLDVPAECMGMLIGKKGENLKRIEEQCKVSVSIEDGGGKASTATSSRRVTVKGAAANVAMAIRELDFTVEAVEVPEGMVGWACGKGARHLKLIREISGAAVVNLYREGDETGEAEPEAVVDAACKESSPGTPSNKSGRCWIHLKGRREHVADARLCLDAHLSYYPAFQDMDEVEAALEEQIAGTQERLGRRACAAPNGNGGVSSRRQLVHAAGGRGRGDGRGGKWVAASEPANANTSGGVSGGIKKGRGKGRGGAAIGQSPTGVGGQGRGRSRGRAS